jgi:aminoglycoside phosphotransferase
VDLWQRAEQLIRSSCGWSLQPLRVLGRVRDGRRTWLAEGEPGLVIVKATSYPFAAERAAWAPQALAALADRGYPVPKTLWHGPLDERWSLVVLERLPGEPLQTLDDSTLEALLALVELQHDLAVEPGGWDTAEWIERVLFDRWEGWWDAAEAAAPETCRRLHAFVEPARGYRLPGGDLVHGDLNLTNVLAEGGAITGVVDWDAIGCGSRASDLAGLLFDRRRLRLGAAGDTRIVNRIVVISGDEGLRCAIGYGAVVRLGLSAQRGEHADLATWRRVTDEILDA